MDQMNLRLPNPLLDKVYKLKRKEQSPTAFVRDAVRFYVEYLERKDNGSR